MNRNRKKRKGSRPARRAICALGAVLAFTAPQTALAASPEFAYSEERWAQLRDDKLEFDEIADLIREYNTTVRRNQIDFKDYQGKDNEEISETYYDTADEIYASIEYPDSDEANYGSLLAAAQSSELSADQMVKQGDNNVSDEDVVSWGYQQQEKSLVQTAQNQMIAYWEAVVSLESSQNAAARAQKELEVAQAGLAAGTRTQSDVLNAQEALLTAQSNVTTAESKIASTRESLCLMLGWKYGDTVEIGALPEPAAGYSSTINLAADQETAVASNYSLKILERQAENSMNSTLKSGYETSLAGGTESVKNSVSSAYQSLLLAELQYEQAKNSLTLAENEMQKADRQKAAGLISANAYANQQYSYTDAQIAEKTASYGLLQAQLAYRWAVDGLAASS